MQEFRNDIWPHLSNAGLDTAKPPVGISTTQTSIQVHKSNRLETTTVSIDTRLAKEIMVLPS